MIDQRLSLRTETSTSADHSGKHALDRLNHALDAYFGYIKWLHLLRSLGSLGRLRQPRDQMVAFAERSEPARDT